MKENVSSFLDGELGQTESEQLIKQLVADNDLRGQWRRYNTYRSVMRDELSPALSSGFSDRVIQALADEPVQLAPASLPKRNRLRGPVGFAIAASLIGIAILLQKPVLLDSSDKQTSVVADLSTSVLPPLPVQKSTVAVNEENPGSDLIVANSKNENVRERINRLLVEHNEYNPASDMTGIWSYSHFVGYNPDTDAR